jgi:glycosyltransferase involved in cell wall biosynthesis
MKLVSVIIPTYSRPEFLCRAIDSVLNQTYKPIEIIVVDDNGEGTDFQKETEEVLRDYIATNKILYFKHEINKNGSAARNTGIKLCHGYYVTCLDDDDELMPSKIEKQVVAIESSHGKFQGAYCGVIKKKNGRILSTLVPKLAGNLQTQLLAQEWGFGTGSNPLFCKFIFDEVGFFDETFIRKQDVEMMVRFFRKFEIAAVPDILIIKNVDSVVRRPNPQLYSAITNKFLKKYAVDIDSNPKNVANNIRYQHWFLNALLAFNVNSFSIGIELLKKAFSFKSPSVKDCFKVVRQIFNTNEMR